MDDVISRQEVIDALDKHLQKTDVPVSYPGIISALTEWLNELPSAQAERKKGKWIYGESEAGNDGYYCSKCGNFVPWKYDEYDIDFIKEFLFCNKCGADMREPEDIPMEYFESGGR